MDQSVLKVKVELAYPIGFQLHLTTWENDCDHFKNQVISGLTEADVNFYLSFAKLFYSRNDRDNPGIANEYQSVEMLKDMLIEHIELHPDVSQSIKEDIDDMKDDEYEVADFIMENILGEPVDYDCPDHGEVFCRVFESFKVVEIREPVIDVTKQFK